MNLKPYSIYFFYLSLLLFLVFCIMTLLRLQPLLKSLQGMQTQVDIINKQTKSMQEKMEVRRMQKEKLPDVKTILSIYILVKAIRKEYKKNEEKGVQGIRHATTKVVQKQMINQQLKTKINKIV